MVKIDRSHAERKQKNLEISQIIDETILEYEAISDISQSLTFFRNKYADTSDPDNWLYSDRKQEEMVFNGELKIKDYLRGESILIVMKLAYFDWATEVAEKIEAKLGLEVTLKELYD